MGDMLAIMNIRNVIAATALVGAGLVAVACAPPTAIRSCNDSGHEVPVDVLLVKKCPPFGWNVLDPLDGGSLSQGFPCGLQLATHAEDDGCAYFTAIYHRATATSDVVRARVTVQGPAWMVEPNAVETRDGYKVDVLT